MEDRRSETAHGNDDIDQSEMFNRILVSGDDVFYRSQQRGECDLTNSDKLSILKELFTKKPAVFLERYHRYINSDSIHLFEPADERVSLYLEAIQERQRSANMVNNSRHRRAQHVCSDNSATTTTATTTETRNRRYAELLRLRAAGVYFSNENMRERAPQLFDMMVGKYLDDNEKLYLRPTVDLKLSNNAEKSHFACLLEQFDETQRISDRRNLLTNGDTKLRNTADPADRFISHVEHRFAEADTSIEDEDGFEMEFDSSDEEGRQLERERQRHMRRRRNFGALANEPPLMRQQRKEREMTNKSPNRAESAESQFSALQLSKPKVQNDEIDEKAETSRRVTDVEDEEWSSGDEDENLATGISKEQLREEFVSIMEQRFINGQDAAFFDYATLDSLAWSDRNAALNRIREQDLEDAYFADG